MEIFFSLPDFSDIQKNVLKIVIKNFQFQIKVIHCKLVTREWLHGLYVRVKGMITVLSLIILITRLMHTWINQNTQNVNYASKKFAHDDLIQLKVISFYTENQFY